jgi:hypothetical protein
VPLPKFFPKMYEPSFVPEACGSTGVFASPLAAEAPAVLFWSIVVVAGVEPEPLRSCAGIV